MRVGIKHIGISLGVLALAATGYVASYTPGNYVQGGGYTGAQPVIVDAAGTTMSVAIADSADPVITGADAYSYSVTLTNTGAVAATTVSVATTLDGSLAYVSSSGTGWACGASGQVVTCTRATAPAGAQPAITINVTTGSSAVSASSSVLATAANASNATASQGTTVQLVSKDALAGVYLPANATEWSRFLARKGLAMPAPDSLWAFQLASGNATDSIGSLNLPVTGTPAYQQAVAGWSRVGVTFALGSTQAFTAAAASGPNPATTSSMWFAVAKVTTSASSARSILAAGGAAAATECTARVSATAPAHSQLKVAGTSTNGTDDLTADGVVPVLLRYDRTNSRAVQYSAAEELTGTYSASVTDGAKGFGAAISPCAGMTILYGAMWQGANAEGSDASLKALLQAMGFPITWT